MYRKTNMTAKRKNGFTLVEMIVLVVILSLIALAAVPMIGSAGTMQLKAAANKIAADLEYAKSMAISRQKTYTIGFDALNERYWIMDSDGLITNPINNKTFMIDFATEAKLNRVEIDSVDFDSVMSISFDYLGSPYAGSDTSSPLTDGTNGITIKVGDDTMEILVEPVTGYITIQ